MSVLTVLRRFRSGSRLLQLALWMGGAGVAWCATSDFAEAPLAARSTPEGATMFTMLAPDKTGVVTQNDYSDPKMWTDNYQELIYGSIGTGVAIGDYDGDGRPDIFVVSKTERSRLFRNLGNWKFEDVTDRAGLGPVPTGWTDTVKGWIGSGNSSTDLPEFWKQGATFVDVNNDGRLDLYVCRFRAPNLLYINRGDGTFTEEAAARGLAVRDGSGMAAFCDYDRDGWLDVCVQTNYENAATHPKGRRDYLFHNNRDGTFTNVSDAAGISGESAGHSVTWWDYDGDGWPDLYVANDYDAPDRLYRNNRDGTFTDQINRVVPHMPYYAMGSDLGDVNNDGLIDFLVADMAPTTHEKDQRGMAGSRARAQLDPGDPAIAPQYMRNALYLNTGTGRMLEAAVMAGVQATDWTWSVRFEDLDNDGRLDLHVTNGMAREYHNVDLLERIMALENPSDSRRLMKDSPVLNESNLAFRNLGDLRFENVGPAWGLDQKGVSFGAAFGDLDGDGDLDLVYCNYQNGVTLLRNDSQSGHRLIVALRGTQSNRFGVGATVRIESASGVQVRQLVLARGYLSSSEPSVHFGLGDDSVITRLTVDWPSGHKQTFENVAVDRRLTISEPSIPAKIVPFNETRGLFTAVTPPAAETTEKPGPVKAEADFNRDGRLDTFVGGAVAGLYPLAGPSAILAGGDNGPIDVTDSFLPALRNIGLVTSALWSDVDNDGWIDLLVSVEWGGIRYFHNQQGRGFEDWSGQAGFAAAGNGWWSALAAGDFNGDGRLDYVAGNLGLNTRYHATPERPALIFQGNFGGSTPLNIEAYYEGDRLLTWTTRAELGKKFPAILKRYPRNDAYARAALDEIVGKDRLAAARRFDVTELRSGVYLSQPDGTFRFQPLPRIGQIAPLRFVVSGDFDGDGHQDIYAVQNSFASPPAVGRFDGGLSQLFRGDGHGQFTPVAQKESKLVVPGEPTSLIERDLNADGWPDFVVTRAAQPALAFQNNGVAGRRSFCIDLQGGPGNPTGIGARVVVEFTDGTRQLSEVHDLRRIAAGLYFGYKDNNPPRRILVRWPSGAKSEHEVKSISGATITLTAPDEGR